jgi:hypothetical protein
MNRLLLISCLVLVLALAGTGPPAYGAGRNCKDCHSTYVTKFNSSKHVGITGANCTLCHAGAAAHAADPDNPNAYPAVRFNSETCSSCHADQYASFEKDYPGRTYYGGSQSDGHPPSWSKTQDLPFWNALIDGHPFVIETFEERAMKFNQIDARDTRRPMGESCLTCHGTKMSYYMGLNSTGDPIYQPPVKAIKNTIFVTSGNFNEFQLDKTLFVQGPHPKTGKMVWGLVIPAGTMVSTFVDAQGVFTNPVTGVFLGKPHQVISKIEIPDAGVPSGKRIYTTYYDAIDPTITASGSDPVDARKRTDARNHIWAALEALSRDGQTYAENQPSIDGLVCMQCHDSHTGKLRIIQKALIQAVAERGVNPYDPVKSQMRNFNQASRQDKIIMVCAQCHSEYVGGYSAVDMVNRHYFPWGKTPEVETQYQALFNYYQDWKHGTELGYKDASGKGILGHRTRPYQSRDAKKRGYYPEGSLFPIGEPLVKTQHPEAEVFLNSKMYRAGATCTDCHTARKTRPDGTRYTDHYFASPIKYIDHENVIPCADCHTMDGPLAKATIKDIQDKFFLVQERAQVALVNSLKFIKNKLVPGSAQYDAAVANHKQAHLRWEYYAQGENSMSFHNAPEATAAVGLARLLVQNVAWPLPPVQVKATAVVDGVQLSWLDQAADESGYVIQRRLVSAPGSWTDAVTIPSDPTTKTGLGTRTWTDTVAGGPYLYRIAAYTGTATPVPSVKRSIYNYLPYPLSKDGIAPLAAAAAAK